MRAPRPATPLRPAHPLAAGLAALVVFDSGGTGIDLVRRRPVPPAGSPAGRVVNGDGLCARATSVDQHWTVGDELELLDSREITVALIRRKTDAQIRNHQSFGNSPSTIADQVSLALPFSNAYSWTWGNVTLNVPLAAFTAAGFSHGLQIHRFVATAGRRGPMELWCNGVRLGSQANGNVSVQNGGPVVLNRLASPSPFAGDLQEINLLLVSRRQWSEAELRLWYADPWSLVRAVRARAWLPWRKPARSVELDGRFAVEEGLRGRFAPVAALAGRFQPDEPLAGRA
jgi:hypothetical protein